MVKNSKKELNNLSKLEKDAFVNKIFTDISKKYDLMNNVMSLGLHHLWKEIFVDFIQLKQDHKVLDLACGSGDISNLLIKKYPHFKNMFLSDRNRNMLEIAKIKLSGKKVNYSCNMAEKLPYQKDFFDFVLLAFGLRNFTDQDKSLNEIYRVLKTGSSFMCLEFSQVNQKSFKKIINLYYSFIPKLGLIFAQNKEAYEYLIESIKLFPNQIELTKKFKYIGFKNVECFDLFDGIASIHIGNK